MDAFSVDTQLFRELGELLVGRDSTALTELVKNAYDADATRVEVIGQHLDDLDHGQITIVDNGVGMTAEQFRKGYLTIAGRGKGSGTRRSVRYGRRYSGEKGIGRLATHKLAHRLRVTSTPGELDFERGRSVIDARIDWDRVESYDTLDSVGPDALGVRYRGGMRPRPAGTAVALSGLRHRWHARELERFVRELGVFQPPALLVDGLPPELVAGPVLLERVPYRDADIADPFELQLSGDFDLSDDLWTEVRAATNWIVEIESTPRAVRIGIVPTPRTLHETPSAKPERVTLTEGIRDHPAFVARILAREGVRGTRRTGEFVSQAAGIRVYMEGFRVASYGEPGDDWLGLDRTYSRRTPKLHFDLEGLPKAGPDREGLRSLPNNAYVGAVLLTHAGAPNLQMLVNREGFIESPEFEAVRETVRTAINLLTRTRARYATASPSTREESHVLLSAEDKIRDGLAVSTDRARTLRTAINDLGVAHVEDQAEALVEELNELVGLADQMSADRGVLRVVAAVGTQMAAFVHETEGLVGAAQSVSHSLELLADRYPDRGPELADIRDVVSDLSTRLATQVNYLSDTTSVAMRRRRQRLSVSERFSAVRALLEPATSRLDISVIEAIDANAKTVPMYSGELTVILTNLMTNAVKAAGSGGTVRFYAKRSEHGLRIRISNTGKEVDLTEGESWFRPFASTSVERIDPLLGQGMGLGLPITRSIVEDYKGSVAFVSPQSGYTTTVVVRLP